MRIILDTDKKLITVPWNYAAKLDEMNRIIQQGGGTKTRCGMSAWRTQTLI